MNSSTAKSLKLKDQETYLGVPVVINESVADNCVFINTTKETIEETDS
jgi:hypothetical protein